MEKHKATRQKGFNSEISTIIKKEKKKEKNIKYKKKKVDKNRDALKRSTKKRCISTTFPFFGAAVILHHY